MKEESTFCGYERREGVGIRNHVLILPTVICSVNTAVRIGNLVRGCKVAAHSLGCAQAGEDLETTYRTLRNTARNPNVASTLIVSLGCEKICTPKLADDITNAGKNVELLTIQDVGDTRKTIDKGARLAKKLVKDAASAKKKAFDISELAVAVECGGSDWTSGISANPATGYAVDRVIDEGGTAVFSETAEIVGAEHILSRRIASKENRDKLINLVKKVRARFEELGLPARETNPSRGNIAGGITTLEEKSLGAIYKAGTRSIEGVLNYSYEIPKKNGLYFMDTPGHDVESIAGMVAGGAQIVVFTTGSGTPTGNPIAPVIKVAGNPDTYRKLKRNMDVNAGTIIEGKENIPTVGEKIYRRILSVSSGQKTRTEILGHEEFSIMRVHPSF